jgi:transcriptional regulator with XRE-family HTH domain
LHSATTKKTNQVTVQSPQKAQPLLVEIGSRLRHARLSKGTLIKDLAERVGVSNSLISKYENNKLLPPPRVRRSVVTELGTNIGALFAPNWNGVDYVACANGRPRSSAAGDGEPAGMTLERLVPHGKGHLLQGNIQIVAPGGGRHGAYAS